MSHWFDTPPENLSGICDHNAAVGSETLRGFYMTFGMMITPVERSPAQAMHGPMAVQDRFLPGTEIRQIGPLDVFLPGDQGLFALAAGPDDTAHIAYDSALRDFETTGIPLGECILQETMLHAHDPDIEPDAARADVLGAMQTFRMVDADAPFSFAITPDQSEWAMAARCRSLPGGPVPPAAEPRPCAIA